MAKSEGKHPCQCGCGELVAGRFKRGHYQRWIRQQQPEPIPGPDDPFDLGEIFPDGPPPSGPPPPDFPPEPPGTPEDGWELPPDAPPGHLTAEPDRASRSRGRARGPKVTAATRRDIEAKLGIMLMIPARLWAIRDPLCGGKFAEQLPDIRAAAVELICQSADLVEWFTGVGGGFMLWLNLAAACQPVAVMVWAHHIAHSVEAGDERQAPDMARYAA